MTIWEIKQRNKNAGKYWFEPATMRFFNSRISSVVIDLPDSEALFVSSEKFDWKSPRLYTIRRACKDGNIDTVGEFQEFKSLSGAIKKAQRIAKQEWRNNEQP